MPKSTWIEKAAHTPLTGQRVQMQVGGYDDFLDRRAARLEAAELEAGRARTVLKREAEWMRRQPKARESKAKTREERFYDLQEVTERARACTYC